MFIWISEKGTVMKCLSESAKQDNKIKCLSESVNQGIVNKSFKKWSLANSFVVSQNIILVIKISSKIFFQ
jgi:hypothetical protein